MFFFKNFVEVRQRRVLDISWDHRLHDPEIPKVVITACSGLMHELIIATVSCKQTTRSRVPLTSFSLARRVYIIVILESNYAVFLLIEAK